VKTDLAQQLNPEQIAAVTHGEGPQLVLAGAGSGKTRVITFRISWLVEERGVDPSRIVAVTFTNKAAHEMRERVEKLLGLSPLPAFVGTFHRYALTLLRRYGERVGLPPGFGILDASDQRSLVKQALTDEQLSEKAFTPQAVLGAISSAKNRLLDHMRYADQASTFFEKKVAQVYRRYQTLAKEAAGIDFDDMIALSVRLLEREADVAQRVRFRAQYLLVDEYQDTNHAQLALIRLLVGAEGNLTAVGDEDQGIYRWRGAELENILRFEDAFPGAAVRKLERNYRSTQTILDASGAVVANNLKRRGKTLWTESGSGDPLELYRALDEGDEAQWVVSTLKSLRPQHPLPNMAILVRTNAQTRALEDELLRQEVPYTLVGGVRFYERAEVKDLIAYLRVLRNPRDGLSLGRIINQPPRGIGKSTLDRLREEAMRLGQPIWDLLYQNELGGLSPKSAQALRAFRDLVLRFQEKARVLLLPELLEQLIQATGFTTLFSDKDPDDVARLENIQELVSAAQTFVELRASAYAEESDLLTAFLDHVSLMTDLEGLTRGQGVPVMTLHSAKGLEFDAVFLAGCEDGLLPHFNAQGGRDDLEEERRLFYVGMTRARRRLFLSTCRRRRVAGYYQDQLESPFLAEIPKELIRDRQSPALFQSPRVTSVYSFFQHKQPPAASAPTVSPGYERAPAAPAATPKLSRGARVRHATLGEGVVLEIDGSGADAKLTIFFDQQGKRRLVARYANLELV
jgi:DNA helicase II / ATP-dependent DNA helicase PcrA